jgi:regulator of replication initiation timing
VELIRRADLISTSPINLHNRRVCSVHFEDKMFVESNNRDISRLAPHAIPTLMLQAHTGSSSFMKLLPHQTEVPSSIPLTCGSSNKMLPDHMNTCQLLSSKRSEVYSTEPKSISSENHLRKTLVAARESFYPVVCDVGVQCCIDYPQNDSTKTNKEVHKVKEEDTSQILYIKKLREIIKSLRNNLSSKTRSLVRLKVVVNHLRNKLREKTKGETVHEKKRTQSNKKVSRVFRKGMRWTPEAKKQAIGLYLKSPAAYSAIRTQQFMNLPHKRTLLRTVHQLFEKVSRVYLLTYTV